MNETDLIIIRRVQQHPCLYNKLDIGFRIPQERDKAWASVAAACGLTVQKTKIRWKVLRNHFVREQHKSEDERTWEFNNDIIYLKDHIQLRGWQNIQNESQMELDNNQPVEAIDVTNEKDNNNIDEYEDNSMTNFVNETPVKTLQQAESEFVKVMGLLEDVLKEKLSEQKTTPSETHCGSLCQRNDEQDPYYKFLESILNRVNETKRVDIQFKLLNLANELIKKANDI
ncbi:uncharacterized protein LOC117789080 [Drosophila innubila]|uniref:uncharacterized protein LOC117789080 n=1 Tax=Drosophila innubila TaxID=198719 RepID=UPI00148BFA61|nr:uncharacterized protein LOC117789080 [Drosophila innubila]